jgi:hypothetical protein
MAKQLDGKDVALLAAPSRGGRPMLQAQTVPETGTASAGGNLVLDLAAALVGP